MASEPIQYRLLKWDTNADAAAKPLQSCPTLCDPIDGSPPGCPVPGILQARTLEWVAISFSNAWKWKVKVKSFSHVSLLATAWTAAYQAPPSLGVSRQEYWHGVPLPSPWPLLVIIKTEWSGQSYCPTEPHLLHPCKWESWNKSFLLFPKFDAKSYGMLRKIKTSIKLIQKQKHLYIKDKKFRQVVLVSFHIIHEN